MAAAKLLDQAFQALAPQAQDLWPGQGRLVGRQGLASWQIRMNIRIRDYPVIAHLPCLQPGDQYSGKPFFGDYGIQGQLRFGQASFKPVLRPEFPSLVVYDHQPAVC
jgi:hypothetical protein